MRLIKARTLAEVAAFDPDPRHVEPDQGIRKSPVELGILHFIERECEFLSTLESCRLTRGEWPCTLLLHRVRTAVAKVNRAENFGFLDFWSLSRNVAF